MKLGRLLIWVMVVGMPLWLGSCKKDNADDGVITPNSIEGNWKMSAMKISDGSQTQDMFELIEAIMGEEGKKIVACLTDITITFNSNKKVTGQPSPKCESEGSEEYNPIEDQSTWSVSSNKVSITDSDGTVTYDLTLSGNTMSWSTKKTEDLDGDGTVETYTEIIEFKRA